MPFYPPGYYPEVSPADPASVAGLRRGLVARFNADAGLNALVGGKVFRAFVPQYVSLPALTYQLVSDPRGHNLDGPDGVSRARMQFAACSLAEADCDAIASALRRLLDGYAGTLPGGTVVLATTLNDEHDFAEPPADDSDAWTYRVVLDYWFLHRDPVPTS